jgi:hypothetical protein
MLDPLLMLRDPRTRPGDDSAVTRLRRLARRSLHGPKRAGSGDLALRALRDADRIVVAGVSFAPTDLELKWLLRAATLARRSTPHLVCVVNPDSHARARAATLLAHEAATLVSYASIRDLIEDRALAEA